MNDRVEKICLTDANDTLPARVSIRYLGKSYRVVFLLLMLLVSGSLWQPAYVEATTESGHQMLWLLATDADYRSAKIVAFDVESEDTVEEIALPAHLKILSAGWSPNMEYIAGITGEVDSQDPVVGSGMCLFTSSGESLACFDFAVPVVVYDTPRPVWSQDSRYVYVPSVSSSSFEYEAVSVVVADVQRLEMTTIPLSISLTDYIIEWSWSPTGKHAAIVDEGMAVSQIRLVGVQPEGEVSSVQIAGEANFSVHRPAWLPSGEELSFVSWTPETEEPMLWRIQTSPRLGTPELVTLLEYHDEPLSRVTSLAWSNDVNQVAVGATYYDDVWFHEHAAIYVKNISADEALTLVFKSPIGERVNFGNVDYNVRELTWAPDDDYLVFQLCERRGPALHSCKIYVIDMINGDYNVVDTDRIEHSNPMWNTWMSRP